MDEIKPTEPLHKFCEQIFINSSPDVFLFGMRSGGEMSAYVITPDHAKQLLRLLQGKVDEYEAQNGKLEGRLPTDPTISPIQPQKPN